MSHRCIPLLFLAMAGMLSAQDQQPATVTVQGHVFSADGSRLAGATVTMTSGPSTYVAVTDSGTDPGKYTLSFLAGTYDITTGKRDYRPELRKDVPLKGSSQIDFVLELACSSCNSGGSQLAWAANAWGTLFVVFLFFVSIWLVRWNNIARPNREQVRAEVDNERVRFQTTTGSAVAAYPYLDNLLNEAENATKWNRWTWVDFLFWSRVQEITGWARIHEFQRATITQIPPTGYLETIRARLQAIELDLLDIDKTHAKTLASNIKDALEEKTADEAPLRALLVEALSYLNDQRDTTFAQLVGWQTKTVWLVGVGCALIVVLAFAVGNAILFIAGATGGLLSRLARALKRADVPSDYGASWTTLFLSPIVGALSGWFGILLVVLLAKLQVLGTAFQAIEWGCPLAPLTLAMAFALGFSERLFDGIVSSLEDKVDSDRQAAKRAQQLTSKTDVSKKGGDGAETQVQAAASTRTSTGGSVATDDQGGNTDPQSKEKA